MRRLLLGAAACAACISGASAQTIVYDNTTTYSHNRQPLVTTQWPNSAEMGDEVHLAGTDRLVVEIKLRFWYSGTTPGTFDARIRFRTLLEDKQISGPAIMKDGAIVGYLNTATPGPAIYESPITKDLHFEPGMNEYTFKVPRVKVPDRFVWTVQAYNGKGMNDSVGPAYYDPPTVGWSDDFLWISDMGSPWIAYSWGSMPAANLAARILAVAGK
jgi:hypothetical protein